MSDDDLLQPQQFEDLPEGEEDEAAEAEAEQPKAEEKPQDPPADEPKEQMVPLAALQAEREEKRGLKTRVDRLEQYLTQMTQQNQPRPPSMQEDPEGFMQMFGAQIAAREANITAEMSEKFARIQHTDAVVDEAFAAAEAAGALNQFIGKRDAWGELVKWHKAQKALKEIGDDPEAYKQRMRQELMAELAAERANNPANQPAPSLAGETNLGARTAPAWSGPTPLDDILGNSGSSF